MWKRHEKFERNSLILVLGIILVVSIGGLIEIAPLFYLESTIEKVDGVRPYTPLEQSGRDIYVREGCYVCHSQMIRPLRDEVERYGHYSLAAESMYDHPFQWGSKRTGPDLARVGGKYSDDWHRQHLTDPRSVVPESNMPPYAFLAKTELDTHNIKAKLATLKKVGVPYTDDEIANASKDLATQADPFASETSDLRKRYGAKVNQRDFDGDPARLTELDALVAYLQVTGTMVDFKTYKAEDPENMR
jgi:cytochrome c oxidase cbb3-type subunit 2